MTQSIDLNLLVALDALLTTGSVTLAAEQMNLSAPAMSRTLGRLRHALGDKLLVRAGRGLVPTPRADALRPQLRQLIEQASAVLTPPTLGLASLERVFTIRANDGVAGVLAGRLAVALAEPAPGIVLRFVPEGDEDSAALRDGRIDLDIGAVGEAGPEVKVQTLLHDRFVGVVRRGHALLDDPSPAAFAACRHISASRRGRIRGPIDAALAQLGLTRLVGLVVPSAFAAVQAAAATDLVAAVPALIAAEARRQGLAVEAFALPVEAPPLVVALSWHPRLDTDPAHRWLRERVRAVVTSLDSTSAGKDSVSHLI